VPGLEPGVVDALLGIGGTVQNIHGHRQAIMTVDTSCMLDGGLVAGEVEGYDICVAEGAAGGVGERLATHGASPFMGVYGTIIPYKTRIGEKYDGDF
jgi:hypothetical protein